MLIISWRISYKHTKSSKYHLKPHPNHSPKEKELPYKTYTQTNSELSTFFVYLVTSEKMQGSITNLTEHQLRIFGSFRRQVAKFSTTLHFWIIQEAIYMTSETHSPNVFHST